MYVALALGGCADFDRGEPGARPEAGVSDTGTLPDGAAATFAGEIHRLLLTGCADCHAPGASAGATGLVLTGAAASDQEKVLPFVNTTAPSASRLLTKGAGRGHGGGAIYREDSAAYAVLLAWITAGAPR